MSEETGPERDGPLILAIAELTSAVRALTLALERSGRSADPAHGGPGPRSGTAMRGTLTASSAPAGATVLEEVRHVVAEVFRHASNHEDEDAAFEEFVVLHHSERTSAPRAIPSLKEFSWRQIKKRVGEYLKDAADPTSFAVARSDPPKLDDGAPTIRLFLVATGRSPTPVTLRRDPSANGAWRIADSSL